MKKYIMIGILFAFPFCLSADEPVKAIYAKITNPDNKEITVVAHRADWRYAPGTQNQASCTYFGRGFMGCQRSCDGQSG